MRTYEQFKSYLGVEDLGWNEAPSGRLFSDPIDPETGKELKVIGKEGLDPDKPMFVFSSYSKNKKTGLFELVHWVTNNKGKEPDKRF